MSRSTSTAAASASPKGIVWSHIVAVARDGAIGKQGSIPWHLPADLKRFKSLTMGHIMLMGRKTYESFGARPLPGRLHIVVSQSLANRTQSSDLRESRKPTKNVHWVASLTEAKALVERILEEQNCLAEELRQEHIWPNEVFVIGGERVYRETLSWATRFYITDVDCVVEGADTYYPIEELMQRQPKEVETSDGAIEHHSSERSATAGRRSFDFSYRSLVSTPSGD